MVKVCLGDVAIEYRENCKGDISQYPQVGLEHLDAETITLSRWDTEAESTFTKKFSKGQILFGRRRAYLKKAAVAPFDGICSGDITVIKAIPEKILPEYLPFIIQNDRFFDFAVEKSAGSLSPRVKWEQLKKYEFDLPPLEEQKRLADILWAAEENRQKCLAALEKLSQYSDVILKDKKYYETTVPLSEIALIIAGQSPEQSAYNSEGRGMPFYQGKVSFGLKYILSPKQWTCQITKMANPGDILMSIRAPVGPVNISTEKCCIGRGLAAIRANTKYFNQMYLYYVLRSMEKQIDEKYGKGSTFRAITKDDLNKIPIPFPTIENQTKISKQMKQIDDIAQLLRDSIDKITSMQKCLLNEE